MPYPYRILKNEKIPASSHDVETFVRHALGQHLFIVEKENLDETNKRYHLQFWQRDIALDRYMNDGKIGKTYWGGAEIIEWSDSTEIVRMWAAIPADWYVGEFGLNKDKVMEERFGWLEELSNEIQEYFVQPVNENQAASGQEMIMPNNSEQNGGDIRRNVFVVYGRNEALRRSIFDFLRAIGLSPIEWAKAIAMTGKGSPFIGDVLDKAMAQAQAIVVLFTGDDEAKLKDEFQNDHDSDYEKQLTSQARPNVLFEAGMAFGKYPDRTILVQVGHLRPFSDIAGRHLVNLNDSLGARQDIAQRLKNAGCIVDTNGTDWHSTGKFDLPVEIIKDINKHLVDVQVNFPPEAALEAIAGNSEMSVDEIKILIAMAHAQESHPGSASVALIAKLMNLNGVKISHYCENLNYLGYLHKEGFSSQNGEIYELTSDAKKFLVKEHMI